MPRHKRYHFPRSKKFYYKIAAWNVIGSMRSNKSPTRLNFTNDLIFDRNPKPSAMNQNKATNDVIIDIDPVPELESPISSSTSAQKSFGNSTQIQNSTSPMDTSADFDDFTPCDLFTYPFFSCFTTEQQQSETPTDMFLELRSPTDMLENYVDISPSPNNLPKLEVPTQRSMEESDIFDYSKMTGKMLNVLDKSDKVNSLSETKLHDEKSMQSVAMISDEFSKMLLNIWSDCRSDSDLTQNEQKEGSKQ